MNEQTATQERKSRKVLVSFPLTMLSEIDNVAQRGPVISRNAIIREAVARYLASTNHQEATA